MASSLGLVGFSVLVWVFCFGLDFLVWFGIFFVQVPYSSAHITLAGSKQRVTACSGLQTPTPREGGQNTGQKLQPFGE